MLSLEQLLLELVLEDSSIRILLLLFDLELKALKPFAGPEVTDEAEAEGDDWWTAAAAITTEDGCEATVCEERTSDSAMLLRW
mgnify:CR=1 FL=1